MVDQEWGAWSSARVKGLRLDQERVHDDHGVPSLFRCDPLQVEFQVEQRCVLLGPVDVGITR